MSFFFLPFLFLGGGYFLLDSFFLTPYDVMHVYYTCSAFLSLFSSGAIFPQGLLTGFRRNRDPNHLCIVYRVCFLFLRDFIWSFGLLSFYFIYWFIFSGVLKRGFQGGVYSGYSNSNSNFSIEVFEVTVTPSKTGNDLILYLSIYNICPGTVSD